MKLFEENKPYSLFGYAVELVNYGGDDKQVFYVVKGNVSKIAIIADLSFLKDMDSTETRRLELLFRDLENFAKFGDSRE